MSRAAPTPAPRHQPAAPMGAAVPGGTGSAAAPPHPARLRASCPLPGRFQARILARGIAASRWDVPGTAWSVPGGKP